MAEQLGPRGCPAAVAVGYSTDAELVRALVIEAQRVLGTNATLRCEADLKVSDIVHVCCQSPVSSTAACA